MELESIPTANEIPKSLDGTKVPTADEDVRALLRKLQHPVTYFGEDKADRRSRLIRLVNEMPHQNFGDQFEVEGHREGDEDLNLSLEDLDDEEFYTPGPEELLDTRKRILNFSLEKAHKRIRKLQEEYEPDFIKVLKHRRTINKKASEFELFGTQLIPNNTRSIGTVKYSPDNSRIACGSWNGNLYLLDNQLSLQQQLTPGYHLEKVNGIDWLNDNQIITGGNEGNVNLWNTTQEQSQPQGFLKPEFTVKAHEARITSTLIHPNQQNFITTSFDQTWKLWDLNTQQELAQQEGHLKEVFSASIHPDGSLLATGGLDAYTKLWDLRSGKQLMNLQGHTQGIYSTEWSPDGYLLATGSGDCSIKIWDLRKMDQTNQSHHQRDQELVTIPAHTKLISGLKFYNSRGLESYFETSVTDFNETNASVVPSTGKLLLSSSYDGTVNIWSADNWVKVGQLSSFQDKVLSCDISNQGDRIITSHWDKSVKLWNNH